MNKFKIIYDITPAIVLIFFIFVLYKWTLGFTSFTTYAYVLNSAGSLPRKAYPLEIVDQYAHQSTTEEMFRNKYVLLNFMYFHCPYVCSTTIAKLADVDSKLKNIPSNKLMIVSISIDKENDTPEMLRKVWEVHGSPKNWYFVSLSSKLTRGLNENLNHFGIWVYQRKNGIYNHSTYLFLLDPQGNILHVFNAEESAEAITQTVEEILS